ncbi:hypothetical protein PV677_36295 [Streptomyces sp. DE06-01C]|uniref:hypothetical protein n=1 Tax=Streptomyces sp. DE06-01C TaxID=3028656 RepID=UPI0029C10C16|nr:hypothetical protein [Streptomyces sp. DE06-01C]MDX5526133.1 hypothetical protein [Streptomyces sp. DE06-01C]
MPEAHDQTYIEALGADLAQQNLNALVLAQNGNHQLGQPHPKNPELRIWDGNVLAIGHQDPRRITTAANTVLPARMRVAATYHWHARLTNGTWTRCTPNADNAVPITVTLATTRDD